MCNKKELVNLLGAISVVSKHLAENLPGTMSRKSTS